MNDINLISVIGSKDPCGPKLYQWFQDNKVGWVSALAIVGAIVFMAAAVAIFILRRLQVFAFQFDIHFCNCLTKGLFLDQAGS